MPNWCLNSITITSKQNRNLRQWMDELYDETINWVKTAPSPSEDDLKNSGVKVELITEADFDPDQFSLYYCCKPPYRTWTRQWEYDNFGTKLDIVGERQDIDVQDDVINISVETAYGPPLEAFQALTKRFRDLHVTIEYEEPLGDFAGDATIEAGEIEDNEYTYREYVIRQLKFAYPGATVVELDEEDYEEKLRFLDDLGIRYEACDQLENVIAVYSEDDAVLAKVAAG